MGRFVRQRQGRGQSPEDGALGPLAAGSTEPGVEASPDGEQLPAPFNFTRDVIEPLVDGPRQTGMTFVDRLGVIDKRTFAAIAADATRWARVLCAHGMVDGDRLLVLLGRTPVWHSVVLGALKAGLVVVPCTQDVSAGELDVRAAHSGAELIVTDDERAEEVGKMKAGMEVLLAEDAIKGQPDTAPLETSGTTAEDPALILYVSRPGDEPRGVIHTHGSVSALQLQTEHWLDAHPHDTVWCTDELGSAQGMRNLLFGPWSRGAEIVLHENAFEAAEHFDLMKRLEVTILCQTADQYRALAELPETERRGAHQLRHAVSEGVRLDPGVVEAFQEGFGLTIFDGYARPETALLVANTPEAGMKAGSIGLPLPGYEIAVIDEDGRELPADEEGDIAVRRETPSLFSGFWNAPYATNAVFRDDWYVSGERATRTEDGFLWLRDEAIPLRDAGSGDRPLQIATAAEASAPVSTPAPARTPTPTPIVLALREISKTDRGSDVRPTTTPASAERAESTRARVKVAAKASLVRPTAESAPDPRPVLAARTPSVRAPRPEPDPGVETDDRVPSLVGVAPASAVHDNAEPDDAEHNGDATPMDDDLFARLRAYGRPGRHGSQSGQTLVEYVLILAGIALACLATVVFLSGAINDLYATIANTPAVSDRPSAPPGQPTQPGQPAVPTSVEDCFHGGWRHFPQFENQAACIKFVVEGP